MRTTQLTGVTAANGAFFPEHYGTAVINHPQRLSFQAIPSSTHPWEITRKTRTKFRVGSSSPHTSITRSKMSLFSEWGGVAPSPGDEVSVLQLPLLEAPDVAVVWFTASDLRVHDHDGLLAAAGASTVLPVYVFDDQELVAESPLDATFAYHAVHDLRKSLRSLGSDLIVRSGDASKEIARLVEQAGASHLFFHTSPVHSLRQSHQKVTASLASLELPSNGSRDSPLVQLHSWSVVQLTGVEDVTPSRAWNFRDFDRMIANDEQPARSALPPPASLPPLPNNVEPGDFPSLGDVVARVGRTDERIRKELSKASFQEAPFGARRLCVEGFGESWALTTLDDYFSMGDEDFARSVFGPEHGNKDLLLEETGLEAAATRRIVRARGYGGLAPGEALARALGVALGLGCVSPRRMFLGHRRARHGWRTPRKCWARELALRECWHVLLAMTMKDVTTVRGEVMIHRYLRWNGWLVRYAVGGSGDPSHPVALLVHGFGASSDQWDRVFQEFAATSANHHPGGVRLLALDLIGFGHSAKPPLTYSQYSWADCARDVALRVGGGPFFVAGNSIGGYISMGVAAECRELCQGVILVNSAGRILTPEKFENEMVNTYKGLSVEGATRAGKLGTYVALPNTALALFGAGLLTFLQGRISKICRNVYPVNPDVVDEGLAENIFRDSCDPGAVGVIAAGGKLPFSRSANEMLGKFGGPVLVTQGVKDPLNDAKGRATLFEALGPQVEVVRLDGGHCPHHEIATEVSRAMYRFIDCVQTGKP